MSPRLPSASSPSLPLTVIFPVTPAPSAISRVVIFGLQAAAVKAAAIAQILTALLLTLLILDIHLFVLFCLLCIGTSLGRPRLFHGIVGSQNL